MVKFSETVEIIQKNREREQTMKNTRSHSNIQVKLYKQKRWTQDSPTTLHNLYTMQVRAEEQI